MPADAPPLPADLDHATRAALYAMAAERGIAGRSGMTKAQLRAALEADDPEDRTASRVEQFRELAEAAARDAFVMLPRHLRGDDRRLHVRQTLREDHETRIAHRAGDTDAKFDEMQRSAFSFFRGTALLFYRDMAGDDSWMPTVLTLGDVHPENFGVMPNADNVPIFAVNDFDEAYYAPFTWDLKRGAVGFMIGAGREGGHGPGRQAKIARHFVRGYVDGIRRFAQDGGELESEMRIDNAPKLIVKLFEDAEESRAEWLADDYLDEFGRGFRTDDELVPLTSRREEFQAAIDRLVDGMHAPVPPRAAGMRVKDVCARMGQGTASLGLARYYVLIEGPQADGTDDLIIELKQARRSALAGLVPPSVYEHRALGDRIADAQAVQLVRGDVFYGSIELEGVSFMSRERAPFRDDIDLDDLSKKEWNRYAEICGQSLAHAHALSDEIGRIERDIEPEILQAMSPAALFVDDIVRFAVEAAERVRTDHAAFCADHELGAFTEVDRIYR